MLDERRGTYAVAGEGTSVPVGAFKAALQKRTHTVVSTTTVVEVDDGSPSAVSAVVLW